MSDDLYLTLAAGAQAVRRLVERQGLGIGGALGVAAEPYPHQLATVSRILGDTRIRHLIADEVGLGKTVQALMVLNALRIQNPGHSAVVLAPGRLIQQWQDECWTRAHIEATVFEAEEPGGGGVRLVRDQSLVSGAFSLDPVATDLLIVDEPQTMPAAVMAAVERAAPDFRQVLVLSATPGLGDPARRLQLMRILEPERVRRAELAGEDPLAALDRLEAEALETDGASPALLFSTWCRTRRVIRASRTDWARYLPSRRYERRECEPLGGELERVQHGVRWLRTEADAAVQAWPFAQALHRSPRSARDAIARQRKASPSPALKAASEAAGQSPGDSRLDALLDILGEVWTRSENAQVIVVAGDNPTIDHLSRQLPRYFGTEERPLGIDALRRAGEALESEADDIRAMHDQLLAFSRGQAKVLLIGDWVQAGLNLQHFSGHLVFHSTPWAPDAVDQLIGRLDRLRPGGLAAGDRGRDQGCVTVWSITQRGTVESLLVDALEALEVFERPMPPVAPSEMQAVRETLQAVLSGARGREITTPLKAARRRWTDAVDRSPLEMLDPHTPAAAQNRYDQLQARDPVEPAMERRDRQGFSARREEALRGWTDLLGRMRLFEVGSRPDLDDPEVRFATLWYCDRPDTAPVRLPELERARGFMSAHQPFIYQRSRMRGLPRKLVRSDAGEQSGRLLRFLDDGEALHDGLVQGVASWAARALGPADRPQFRTVLFPPEHPILAHQGRVLLLVLAHADPAGQALPAFDAEAFRARAARAPTEAQRAALLRDVMIAEDWRRTDERWVAQHLPPLLLSDVSVLEAEAWRPLDEATAWSAFKPFLPGDHKIAARSAGATAQPPPGPTVNRGLTSAVRRLMVRVDGACAGLAGDLRPVLQDRLHQLAAEGRDLLDVRRLRLEQREADATPGQEHLRAGLIAGAERRLALTRTLIEDRTDALALAPDKLNPIRPTFRTLLIRPAALS